MRVKELEELVQVKETARAHAVAEVYTHPHTPAPHPPIHTSPTPTLPQTHTLQPTHAHMHTHTRYAISMLLYKHCCIDNYHFMSLSRACRRECLESFVRTKRVSLSAESCLVSCVPLSCLLAVSTLFYSLLLSCLLSSTLFYSLLLSCLLSCSPLVSTRLSLQSVVSTNLVHESNPDFR